MFHRPPRIFLPLRQRPPPVLHFLILVLVGCSASSAQSNENDKQLQEVGLQSCIDGFVVHRNKIIRTQDSREMGAKYLTDFDVESRVECMKLCCKTEHCDVFIFEERKPGTCYLFHCGPPYDFKCKFTNDANYSSAVLTNYNLQSAAALEDQIRRNQQEHELKSLRKLEPPSKEYNYFTGLPASTSTTLAPVVSTTSTTPAPIKALSCSRNQFECRSSDDCIAIYNVCDGIPQCADGSDEAADLGCPVDRTTMPPPPPPPPPIVASPKPYIPMMSEVLRYQQMMQQQQQQPPQHGQYPMMYPGGHAQDGGKGWAMANPNLHQIAAAQEVNYNGRGYNPQQQLQMQQSPDDSVGVGGPAGMVQQQLPINYKPPDYQWNNYQAPIYDPNANKISNNAALDVMHAQNVLPPVYEQEQPPHIFNHKGPGMHLDEMEAANGVYGQDPNRGYASYYPAVIHHPNSWQEGNPVQTVQQVPVVTPAPRHEEPHIEPKIISTTSTSSPPCDPSEKQIDATHPNNNSDKKTEKDETHKKIHTTVMKAKAKSDDKLSDIHENHPAPESIVKEEKHKSHEAELRTMADSHLQESKSLAIAEHIRRHSTKLEDLEMSRPKGAVISLALGLTVTAVMAVLIACRLRVVKRRGRGRGHDSYAHDTDYLVNGMYL